MLGMGSSIHASMNGSKPGSTSGSSGPRLLNRVFLIAFGTYSGELKLADGTVPAGTAYIRAYGIGAGGGHNTVKTGGGAGGDYTLIVRQYLGQNIDYQIGQYNSNGYDASVLYYNNQVIMSAAGGAYATDATPFGQGTVQSNASTVDVGDLVRVGTSATPYSNNSAYGGTPGNDTGDLKTLNLNGVGAVGSAIKARGFGGGCTVTNTGSNTATYNDGTDGVLVVEFWTGVPQ